MVNQIDTLQRLNEEKAYEDKLVEDIYTYMLSILDSIKGLTDAEKAKINDSLGTIISDSRKHSLLFGNLIDMVIENGDNIY